MITAQVERIADTLEEIKALLPGHYEELALHKDRVPLDPRYDIYLSREERGEVLLVTVRRDGVLVGYWISFISPGLHYKTCLTANFDIFYIDLASRMTSAPLVLGREVERQLRARKVQRWYAGAKLSRPEAGRLYTLLGMTAIETHYCKWLGVGND